MSDENVKIKIVGDASEFEATMKSIGKVSKAGLAALAASVGAVSSTMAYATSVGSEYETSLAKVNTIADTSAKSLNSISDEILEMSRATGMGAADLNEAVYSAISAGVDTANSVNFVSTATKLATGGFTTAANSVDVLTTIINAYGKSAENAASISDMLIQTQNKGKTTVDELASNMGKVIPTANAYGVEIDQLCSSYVIMTAKGIATAESTTYLNGLLNELGKSGTVASKALKEETGKTFKELMDDGKSLGEVIQVLQNKANASGLSMGDMFGSAEAGKAAMTIASEGIEGFNKQLEGMAESTGATEQAFETMQSTTETNIKKFNNNIKNAGITFYDKFKEPLNEGLEEASNAFGDLTDEINKGKLGVSIEELGKNAGSLIKKLSEMGKKVIPVLISGLSKVIKYLPAITKLVGVGTAAWVAYKTATNISGVITTLIKNMTAAAAAAGAETVSVNLATVAQYAWNTAIAANPVGLLATAITALIAGIVILCASQDTARFSTDVLTESQRTLVATVQETAKSYEETKDAADKVASAELANIQHTQDLWSELQTLVDKNGKVKEGYEERANFIVGELNKAYGTEVEVVDGVIEKYDEMKSSIAEVIATKKAQFLLETYEEAYRSAIAATADAEKARAIQAQELAEYENQLETAKIKAKEANAAYEKALANGVTGKKLELLRAEAAGYEGAATIEKNKLEEKRDEYRKTESALNQYYKDIATYEKASAELTAGNVEESLKYLGNLSDGIETVASVAAKSAEEQKEILEQQVVDTEVNARLMKEAYKEGVEGVTEAMVKTAQEQADKAKAEFAAVGGNITKGIAEGAEKEQWTLSGAMKSLIDKALAAAKKAAGIASPAKAFKKKVGQFIPPGIAVGIDESSDVLYDSIENQIKDSIDLYESGFKNMNISTPYMEKLVATAKQYVASFSSGAFRSVFNPMLPSVATAGGVTENVYNYVTNDKGDTVVNMEVTLDGETVYQNQKRVSNNHGVNFSSGGDW